MIINIILFTFLIITIILYVLDLKRCTKLNEKIKQYENIKEKEIQNIFKERWEKEEQQYAFKKVELQSKEKELTNSLEKLNISLKEKEKRYNEVNQDLEIYRKGKFDSINNSVAEYEKRKQLEANNRIERQNKYLEEQSNLLTKQLKEKEDKLKNEILNIQLELEEERNKRAAVNEEILRQKKIVDNENFYKIQIDEDSLSDISLLRNIAPRLIHPEAVNKLIWQGYYQKPLAELRKRLLPNGDYSGIYKITRLKTGEVYIGQTTSLDRRFQDHCKSALGIGTLASSTLHRLMKQDGLENFSFEVIEKVSKEKLKEKESFYIDFYDSKNYGMNSISGVKNGTK